MPKPTPIETLLAELHHPNFMTRCNAARQLGQSRDPRAVDALIADLQASDWRTRRNAAQALGVAKDHRAVEPLIAALQDRTATVRQRAVVALGRLKDARAIPALIEMLDTDNWKLHQDTFHALRKFGVNAIPALTTALASANPRQRIAIIDLLGATKRPDAFEPILAAFNDFDLSVRWHAACALGQLGDRRAVEPLLNELPASDVQSASVIVRALGDLGDTKVVAPLLRLLRDDELHGQYTDLYRAITSAVQTMSGLPRQFGGLVNHNSSSLMSLLGPEHMEQLTDMVAGMHERLMNFVTNGPVQGALAAGLEQAMSKLSTINVASMYQNARTDAAQEIDLLSTWLRADTPIKRIAAAMSLPWYWNERALEPLQYAMRDQDADVRTAATWAYAALSKTLQYRQQISW